MLVRPPCTSVRPDASLTVADADLSAGALRLFGKGDNLYHVKDLLGHETLDTLRNYVKLNVEDIRETLRRCHPRERADDQTQP